MPAVAATRSGVTITAMVLVLALSACAQRDDRPIYTTHTEVSPLEVPEDLDEPSISQAYGIPGEFLPELAGQRDDSRPPRVLSSEEARQARSRILFGPRGLYLEVDDEQSSVFRRLGFALNRAEMRVLETDPDNDMYRFKLDHDPIVEDRTGLRRLAFWRRAAIYDYSGEYRIVLEEDEGRTRVILLDENGGIVDLDPAEVVLSNIQERLG